MHFQMTENTECCDGNLGSSIGSLSWLKQPMVYLKVNAFIFKFIFAIVSDSTKKENSFCVLPSRIYCLDIGPDLSLLHLLTYTHSAGTTDLSLWCIMGYERHVYRCNVIEACTRAGPDELAADRSRHIMLPVRIAVLDPFSVFLMNDLL